MITIATCFNVYDAQRLQRALEAGGIASFIPDELSAHHVLMSGGVRVQVEEEDAEPAREIVAEEKRSW